MSLLKLPKMSDEEIEDLIENQLMCRIAFKGEEYPYLAPFRYVTLDGNLYFHFTEYGRKMKLLKKDERVCVQIESYEPDLSSYSFVSLIGNLGIVDDLDEMKRVIRKFKDEAEGRISPNFLVAHGFHVSEVWSVFSEDRSLVIVKLKEVVEKVGLKGP